MNALRHGLLSEAILLPGEDEAALRELAESLRAQLQPDGELENLFVDRIVAAYWRLRRLGTVETGIFVWERYGALAEQAEREARTYESHHFDPEFFADALATVDVAATDKKKHEEALSRARQFRDEQKSGWATLGRTFTRDAENANAFSKLSRYETAIERGLYKALHELQRLQAARVAAGGRGRRRLGDPRGGSLEEVEGVLALFRKNVGSTRWSLAELPFLSTNTVADNRALLVPFETSSCLKSRSNGAGRVPWLFESQNYSVLEER